MPYSAWWDLNSNGDILILHDIYYNPKCKSQKRITFKPHQFQLERAGFRKQ